VKTPELANLARIGTLKIEPPAAGEVPGLISSGEARLQDAGNADLALDSRFDLAYNAAHALSLAALRRHGYRCDNRYVVFQVLPHTLGIPNEHWRVLAKAHQLRNRTEYEGISGASEGLVADIIASATLVRDALRKVLP
jgi:hypothetical protein